MGATRAGFGFCRCRLLVVTSNLDLLLDSYRLLALQFAFTFYRLSCSRNCFFFNGGFCLFNNRFRVDFFNIQLIKVEFWTLAFVSNNGCRRWTKDRLNDYLKRYRFLMNNTVDLVLISLRILARWQTSSQKTNILEESKHSAKV